MPRAEERSEIERGDNEGSRGVCTASGDVSIFEWNENNGNCAETTKLRREERMYNANKYVYMFTTLGYYM